PSAAAMLGGGSYWARKLLTTALARAPRRTPSTRTCSASAAHVVSATTSRSSSARTLRHLSSAVARATESSPLPESNEVAICAGHIRSAEPAPPGHGVE